MGELKRNPTGKQQDQKIPFLILSDAPREQLVMCQVFTKTQVRYSLSLLEIKWTHLLFLIFQVNMDVQAIEIMAKVDQHEVFRPEVRSK